MHTDPKPLDPRPQSPGGVGKRPLRLLLLWEGEATGERLRALLAGESSLELSLERWEIDAAQPPPAHPPPRRPPFLRRLPIPRPGGAILYLRAEEVDWIEGANQYVRLHSGSRTFLIRQALSGLARQLDPRHFQRIHRSAIANLGRVEELQAESPRRRWALLRDGTRLRVSPACWNSLRRALEGAS